MSLLKLCHLRLTLSKLVQEFGNHVESESLDDVSREENLPEFLSPAILNALGLAAFNYDFRDDGEDRARLGASLRDFMCAHTLQLLDRMMTPRVTGPKDLDFRRTGRCSVKVS